MSELSLRPRPNLKTQISPQIWGQVKLSAFMELPEDRFREFIRQIEGHPLFKKLVASGNSQDKIITRRRFPDTDLTHHFYQINEDTMAGYVAPDLAPLLKKRHEIIPRIKKIGLDNFKRFFLYEEDDLSIDAIARACKITPSTAKAIKELVDDLCLLDLTHPASISSETGPPSPDVKIAAVEKDSGSDSCGGGFRIGYFSAHYARGRYVINYKRLYQLKSEGSFPKGEFKKIERFIRQIELVNTRQTILYQAIKKVVETQADYFRTGHEEDLRPFTQQTLARQLGIHRSTVNRTINHKYLGTPWGEEKKLKFFFTNRKRFIKNILSRIMSDSTAGLTDEVIKRILDDKYNIRVARRTVCAYRYELEEKG